MMSMSAIISLDHCSNLLAYFYFTLKPFHSVFSATGGRLIFFFFLTSIMSPSSFLFSYFCCISTKIWTSYHGLQDSYHLVLSKFTLCHSSLLFFIQIGLLNIFSGHPTCQTPCSFRTFACNSAFIWSVFLFPLCITSFFSSSSSLYGNVLHLTSTSEKLSPWLL